MTRQKLGGRVSADKLLYKLLRLYAPSRPATLQRHTSQSGHISIALRTASKSRNSGIEHLPTNFRSWSIKAREIAEEKEAVEQYGSSDSGASLGDILGAALKSDDE